MRAMRTGVGVDILLKGCKELQRLEQVAQRHEMGGGISKKRMCVCCEEIGNRKYCKSESEMRNKFYNGTNSVVGRLKCNDGIDVQCLTPVPRRRVSLMLTCLPYCPPLQTGYRIRGPPCGLGNKSPLLNSLK